MNTELWWKIDQFNLDHPIAEYGFSTRLASENAWTKNFTQKAITEYKKFMYLAATSDYMVSPSEIVDVVWHQHLIFTQSYNEFCTVLGKNIQHIPSTHNREEAEKFKRAKERTKKLYNEAFGEQPPDIWEYDTMLDVLELTKQPVSLKSFIIAATCLALVAVYPCYHLLKPLYIHINNPGFLTGYVILFIIALLVLSINNKSYLRRVAAKWQPCSFIFNLTPFELVFLKAGRIADVVHGIVNQFINTDKIAINSDKTLHLIYYGKDETVEQYTVLNTLQGLQPVAYPIFVGQVVQKPVFVNISTSMRAFTRRFMESKAFSKMFYTNFFVLTMILMLGFVRLLTGISRDKPTGFISMILIISLIITIAFLRYITTLISTNTIVKLYKGKTLDPVSPSDDWDWQYFMLGAAIFSSAFTPLVQRADNSGNASNGCGSGGSCGSSCGGGSCGGGCGGCGGGD